MDKKANRDKRRKNLSYKTKKDKEKEPEKESESVTTQENILPNNWSKYEITEDDELESADFQTLLLEPISNDSHFKFKSEQNWDTDIKSQLELNKYFTLDLKLLAEGISTIPFPQRHNLNENLFNDVELDLIKKHSETNTQKYRKFLEKKFPKKNNDVVIKKSIDEKQNDTQINTNKNDELPIEINKQEPKVEIKLESPKGQRVRTKKIDDDVDDLLNLTIPQTNEELDIQDEDPLLQPTEIKKPPQPQPQSVDLEQWLDDILDD